jgi:hypothetical protein
MDSEYLTLSQLKESTRGWQFPILQVPVIFSKADAFKVASFLREKKLCYRNYTEPEDREILLLVDVPTANLDILAGLDAKSVRLQAPDILVQCSATRQCKT